MSDLEAAMVVFKDGEERLFETEMYAPPTPGLIVFVRADEALLAECERTMIPEWVAQMRTIRERRYKVDKVYFNPILRTRGVPQGGSVAAGWRQFYIAQCVEVFDE